MHSWINTNAQEMSRLLGLVMLMGIVWGPDVQMYWSDDALYSTPPFSCNAMQQISHTLVFFYGNDVTSELLYMRAL